VIQNKKCGTNKKSLDVRGTVLMFIARH